MDLTAREITWRPLPQANTTTAPITRLRVIEEIFLAQWEPGEQGLFAPQHPTFDA